MGVTKLVFDLLTVKAKIKGALSRLFHWYGYLWFMDLFGNMVAILNSVVSNSYYGMLRGRLVHVCIRSLNIPYHPYETRLQITVSHQTIVQ